MIQRGVSVWTLPSPSSGFLSENPNRPPHILLLRCFPPSPNSSFHFRRSDNVPRDSDAEGVISLKAFVKFESVSIRDTEGVSVGRGEDAAPNGGVTLDVALADMAAGGSSVDRP